MIRFEKMLWFFPHGALHKNLKTPESRNLYFQKIDLINFQRLRTVVILSICMSIVMLIIDFLSMNVWSNTIISRFTTLDILLFLYLLPVLVFILLKYPRDKDDIKRTHRFVYKLSLVVSIIWVSLISAIETSNANGMPTFVIGTFLLATVFVHRGFFFLVVLLAGFSTLMSSLFFFEFTLVQIIEHHLSSVFLIITAYLTSRIIYTNNIKAYAANLMLENNNACLDELVKARTRELSVANNKLTLEIAARERYEVQLKKQKEHAEEADRLKSSFLANMSHEIRTPLNGIVGFSDLIQMTNLTEEKRVRYSTIIKKNSSQLLKIIDDIIDISMIESNQLKYNFSLVSIKQIIDSTVDFYTNYIASNNLTDIEFTCLNLIPEKNLEIYTDSTRIQQVINNLISNAFKFTNKGYIHLTVRHDDNEILFTVEDTGIGIEPDKSQIIFERFRQIDDSPNRSYGGTGLGLSISSGIINTLNGNLWLDFSYTLGSRFCFTLPVKELAENKSPINKKIIIKKICAKKRIVIITPAKRYFLFLSSLFEGGNIIHLETFIQTQAESADAIITTPANDLKFYETHLRSLADKVNRIKIFSIVETAKEKTLAKNSGIHFTYQNPLNVNQLVSDFTSVFSSGV